MNKVSCASLLFVLLTLAACASGQPSSSGSAPAGGGAGASNAAGSPGHLLVVATRVEPDTAVVRPLSPSGVARYLTQRMFNADLALLDPDGKALPYLAESLPKLDDPSWQVNPNGGMQTTYHLKPNIVWQDGVPLTASDWVFSWKVYANPAFGSGGGSPFNLISQVSAPDDRTIVIDWSGLYPGAGDFTIHDREFPALPQHLLQSLYETQSFDTFINNPFWAHQPLGLGPYKLDQWEPGSYLTASAFDQHVLGRPKIDRIKVEFIPDANTMLANMLSGQLDGAADGSLRIQDVQALRQAWGSSAGPIVEHPNQWRAAVFQLRPELANPQSVLDPRVRRAVAYAVNKQELNTAIYGGEGLLADSIVAPKSQFGPAVDQSIVRYPFDLRQTEQLMNEAGWTKNASGIYVNQAGSTFGGDVRTNAATDNEAELTALTAQWKQAGFDFSEVVVPAEQAQDAQLRATFPTLYVNNTPLGEATIVQYVSDQIPSVDNRWRGNNRGAYRNPAYDQLVAQFSQTLDPTQRQQQAGQLMQLFTQDEPSISLFFRTQAWAFVKNLSGPQLVDPNAFVAWNMQSWEWH